VPRSPPPSFRRLQKNTARQLGFGNKSGEKGREGNKGKRRTDAKQPLKVPSKLLHLYDNVSHRCRVGVVEQALTSSTDEPFLHDFEFSQTGDEAFASFGSRREVLQKTCQKVRVGRDKEEKDVQREVGF
jgi:hypothetical protein